MLPLTSSHKAPSKTEGGAKVCFFVVGFFFVVEILLFSKPTRCMLTSFSFCRDFRGYVIGIPPRNVSEPGPSSIELQHHLSLKLNWFLGNCMNLNFSRCMLTSFSSCCDFISYIIGIPPKNVSELFP